MLIQGRGERTETKPTGIYMWADLNAPNQPESDDIFLMG